MSYSDKILVYAMRVSEEDEPYQGYVTEIDNTLEAKQAFVGGLIQCVRITPEIDLIVDDEGKWKQYPMNKLWFIDGDLVDIVVGNAFCCRHDNEGNFTSIQYSDIPTIRHYLKSGLWFGNFGEDATCLLLPEKSLKQYIDLDELHRVYRKGRKLRLTRDIEDKYSPKKAGDIFTVSFVDDKANIHGSWASGSCISIIYGEDSFEIIE